MSKAVRFARSSNADASRPERVTTAVAQGGPISRRTFRHMLPGLRQDRWLALTSPAPTTTGLATAQALGVETAIHDDRGAFQKLRLTHGDAVVRRARHLAAISGEAGIPPVRTAHAGLAAAAPVPRYGSP